jgi:CRP-like cAMP-binding protein
LTLKRIEHPSNDSFTVLYFPAQNPLASPFMELESLRLVRFLRDLTDDELKGFAQLITLRTVKPGERIIAEGAPVHALYIVCSGVVHVRRLAQKREMLLGRLGPASFFGEINLFDPGVATASIYAMKVPAELAVLNYEDLRAFMQANPLTGYKIVSGMMTETSRRLRQTSARLVHSAYWGEGGQISR